MTAEWQLQLQKAIKLYSDGTLSVAKHLANGCRKASERLLHGCRTAAELPAKCCQNAGFTNHQERRTTNDKPRIEAQRRSRTRSVGTTNHEPHTATPCILSILIPVFVKVSAVTFGFLYG
jgi:hypothetical protein